MVAFYDYLNVSPYQEWVRESVAEFLGTFILVFMGNCAVAQTVLSDGHSGNFLTINLGYSMGLLIGVLISAGVSGGHLNPAVTLAGAILKKVEWSKVPHYMASQYLGAFAAAACTYLVYLDGFQHHHEVHGFNLTTAGVFATYPRPGLSLAGGLIDQIMSTMVLVMGIYAIVDKKNMNVPSQLVPLYVSLVLLAISSSLGFNEGYAINPARDFAPRFFTYITYWGDQVFGDQSFWYIPIIGPHVGAILGASIYVVFIENMRQQQQQLSQNIRLADQPANRSSFSGQMSEKKVLNDISEIEGRNKNRRKKLSAVERGEKFVYKL